MNDDGFGKWFIAVWIIAALVSMAITGALVYVGIHFAAKYW